MNNDDVCTGLHLCDEAQTERDFSSTFPLRLPFTLSSWNLFTTELVAILYLWVVAGYGVQKVGNSLTISPAWGIILQQVTDLICQNIKILAPYMNIELQPCIPEFNYAEL
jgi:hypothetical protein